MLKDPGNYEAIGGDSYLSGFVKGFEVVPYPYLVNVSGLPKEVGDTYKGNTLFTEKDGKYTANYKESMDILEYLFPKDKNIFLMCGGGGYAGIWFLAQCFGKNESPSIVGNDTIIYDSHGDIMPFGANDNLFEAGLLAEAGVSWNVAEDIRLDFTFRYEGNMTSLVRNTQKNTAHRYYDTMQFAVGCLVAVGGEA